MDDLKEYELLAGKIITVEKMSQRQAVKEAVSQIGLPLTAKINSDWFAEKSIKEMFFRRLEILLTLLKEC